MAIACSCGNFLRVSEKHAGRKVMCPSCGNSLVVPENFSPQQASGQASGGREPAGAAPRAPSAQGGGSRWGGLLWAFLVVGVLGAIGAGYWWFFGQRSGVDPLVYVPADADVIGVVQVGQAWKKLPAPMNGDH